MEQLARDLRFALRAMVRQPGFALVVVATLALGIGANTAIFSVVDAVLLRPLPFPEPDRLVRVWSAYPERQIRHGTISPVDLRDWREQTGSFASLTAYPALSLGGLVLADADRPTEVEVHYVFEDFFRTLGIEAALGRTLTRADHREGDNAVVVLSHATWQGRFGGDPAILGRTLTLSGSPFTVIGVMPPEFDFPSPGGEMWVPLSLIPDDGVPRRRFVRWLSVVGRLKAGVDPAAAKADLDTVVARLAQEYPESNEQLTEVTVEPLHEAVTGNARTPLLTLLAAVGAVLLICCANVANLMLVRSQARSRELAVRAALGASGGRLARQLLTESLVFGLAGGAGGALVGLAAIRGLVGVAPAGIPRLDAVSLDPRVLGVTALVSLATGILFGLAPALRARASDLAETLSESARGSSEGRGRRRLRGGLVAAETALVVVLAIGAGLLLRSLDRLLEVDPGFEPQRAVTMRISAPDYRYPESEDIAGFFRQVRERVGRVPGVEAVGVGRPLPLGADTFLGEDARYTIPGRPLPPEGQEPSLYFRFTSPGFFDALGIPLLQGRDFDDSLDHRDGEPVAIVNATMARRNWPGGDPVGRTVRLGEDLELTVIGVVGDVRQTSLDEEPHDAAYVPAAQWTRRGMSLVVRTESSPGNLLNAIQEAIWDVDPAQPIEQIATLDRLVRESVSESRFSALLLALFAGLALTLAAVGIYGIVADGVQRRTREIGIRMALGARPREVLALVGRQGMAWVAAGLAVGLVTATLLARLIASLLFGVEPLDPVSFAAAAAVLALTALVATLVPARRALRVDPVEALRTE